MNYRNAARVVSPSVAVGGKFSVASKQQRPISQAISLYWREACAARVIRSATRRPTPKRGIPLAISAIGELYD
jgi:hypothetical protein